MRRLTQALTLVAALSLLTVPAAAQTEEPEPSGGSGAVVEPAQGTPDQIGPVVVLGIGLRSGGAAVEAAAPGAQTEVTADLRNEGEEPLGDVVLSLSSFADGVTLSTDEIDLGSIDAGGTTQAVFEIRIARDVCADFLGFGGELTWDGGSQPIELGVQARCPGPRLWADIITFEGGDGDEVPEPGETLDVVVRIFNGGQDPAEGVRGRLTIDHPDVKVLEDRTTWPDIAPGTAEPSVTPLRIRIADGAERAEPCQPFGNDDGIRTLPAENPDAPVSSEAEKASAEEDRAAAQEPQDMPVPFEATIAVEASGSNFDVPFGTQIYCALMDSAAGGREPAEEVEDGTIPLGAPGEGDGGAGSAVPIAAVLLVTAAALLVKLRSA